MWSTTSSSRSRSWLMTSGRRRAGLEIVGEPQRSLEVEVVGRLVEQQQVGGGKQHRGEGDAHAPAAGELGERPPLRPFVEAEAGEDARGARRRCVGADVDEPGLDLGDAQRIVGAFGLFEQDAAFGVGVEHEVDQRLRAARRLLLDPADAGAPGQADRAALRAQLAADEAEQRRLAGAVAADQADMRAGRQRHGRSVDQQAFAEPIGELVEMQHGRLFPCAAVAGKGRLADGPDRRAGAARIAFAAAAVIYAPPFQPLVEAPPCAALRSSSLCSRRQPSPKPLARPPRVRPTC